MKTSFYSIITGSGKYIPTNLVKNEQFLTNTFLNTSGEEFPKSNEEIIQKFQEITEIEERRYVEDTFVTSDIGYFAALDAIESAKSDKETFDYIIVAHNFGDVAKSNPKSDLVPTIAARIKHKLQIANPFTVAYDLPFGCPGWLQALIQADYYIKSGDAKKILVIGSETLSRVSDPHDIDSMLYSDGAGAVIVEAIESETPTGIITHLTRSDTLNHSQLLCMDGSYDKESSNKDIYLKMNGRKLYEYALNTVPQLVKDCIEKSKILFSDIKKLIIHQANAKMDYAILERLYKLYGLKGISKSIMPMTISFLGNNSVATLPILIDMLFKGELKDHNFASKDYMIFASVGAGMNVNAMVYRIP
ncbi:MAG: ketoacyl-ACP synthase III [Bacteroidota bacterium]